MAAPRESCYLAAPVPRTLAELELTAYWRQAAEVARKLWVVRESWMPASKSPEEAKASQERRSPRSRVNCSYPAGYRVMRAALVAAASAARVAATRTRPASGRVLL